MMNDKIKTALGNDADVNSVKDTNILESVEIEKSEERVPKIFTTEEELEAYFIIKNILKDIVPIQDIYYKDNERYMAILYKNKTTKWICRLYFNGSKKYLTVPSDIKREERIDINDVYDIYNKKEELINALQRYL